MVLHELVWAPSVRVRFDWAKKKIAGTEVIRKQSAPNSHLRLGDADMPRSVYAACTVQITGRVVAKTPKVEGGFWCKRARLAT